MPALKANTPQGERKKKRKWDKRRNCASNTLCCMCFLFGPLASVTVIVIRCLTLLKKKKKKAREEKGSSNVFSRLAGNELRAARKRYAGHSLELRNDVGATLHGGDTGGRERGGALASGESWPLQFGRIRGPPTQMETGSSVPLTSSPAGLSRLSALYKTHGCTRQDCSCQPVAYSSNSDSSQITAEDIGRCASMLCNTSDRDSSWWNYDEIEEKKLCELLQNKKKCKQPGYLHREENLILIEYKHEI